MAALPKVRVSARGLSSTMVIQGIIIALFASLSEAKPEDPTKTYDMLYNSGVNAYNSGRWFECTDYMTKALKDYKMYHTTLTDCRLMCTAESKTNIDTNAFIDLAFYDITLKKSDCLRRCKKDKLGNRPEVTNEKVEYEFGNLEPYNYLQLCAYKIENYHQAAAAAYTYLLAHPEHPTMKNNMVFYRSMPEVKAEFFTNIEAKGYQVRYQDGVESYSEEDYEEVLIAMEEALVLYFEEARRCDALCEGPYDHESLPDHVNAIADHYIHVLECRVDCPRKMATFMGKEVLNFLPEHYNYLQFSYYKAGQLAQACKAVATFLMFDPNNKEMMGNKAFFETQSGVTEDWFVPRQVAKQYYERRKVEQQQLNFIRTSYMFADGDLDRLGLQQKKQKFRKYNAALTPLRFGPRDAKYEEKMARHLQEGINITLENDELKGEHRVVVDNFVTRDEAESLVALAGMATQGDGYSGSDRPSPHTDFEKFEGMTIMKAAMLAKYGHVKEDLAYLYLSVTERMRAFLEDYWNLMSPLYFHFTHLVCRTALEEEAGYQCYRDPDDTKLCIDPPKPSGKNAVDAILYLNEEFEGGNFFFAHTNLSVQQIVKPKMSRMVAFEAGDFHGVQAVTRGRRCALALWFTMSELDAEEGHREAAAILRHKGVMETMKNPLLRSMVEDHGIRIVKTEEELNGPERFAADHVVSKEECEKLIRLANGGGRVGDGYSNSRTASSLSPHTKHEKFAALTVNTAAEAGGVEGDGYRASGRGKSQSPHTSHEMFEGLTIIRATQLAAEGKVDLDAVQLYLEVAEKGRKLVETYFDLKTKLYFDFTHLVCRTALHGDSTQRTDLSHPVHSDNCILQPDGSCKREPPAYVQRDYSAIIYLNGDFKGGELFFTHSNLTVQASIKPHQGMLIGFNAGILHGVKAVEAGQRCAIALWYTLNPKFNEKAHLIAWKVVSEMKAKKKTLREEL